MGITNTKSQQTTNTVVASAVHLMEVWAPVAARAASLNRRCFFYTRYAAQTHIMPTPSFFVHHQCAEPPTTPKALLGTQGTQGIPRTPQGNHQPAPLGPVWLDHHLRATGDNQRTCWQQSWIIWVDVKFMPGSRAQAQADCWAQVS